MGRILPLEDLPNTAQTMLTGRSFPDRNSVQAVLLAASETRRYQGSREEATRAGRGHGMGLLPLGAVA